MSELISILLTCNLSIPLEAANASCLTDWAIYNNKLAGINDIRIYNKIKDLTDAMVKDYFIISKVTSYVKKDEILKIKNHINNTKSPVLAVDSVTKEPVLYGGKTKYLINSLDITEISKFPQKDKIEISSFEINSPKALYEFTKASNTKVIQNLINSGVFIENDSVVISPLAKVAKNATILSGSKIYGNCDIAENAVIGPNTIITNSRVKENATVKNSVVTESIIGSKTTVGPFAYLRPNSIIGNNVKIGDFVEIKNSSIGEKTSISHLSYIGDSEVGKNVNIGCGTVTVNYNGKQKFKTIIKDNCFIGCNTNLVAPITVHESAYIGAGSTITEDVPENSLALARERQIVKENWVQINNRGLH